MTIAPTSVAVLAAAMALSALPAAAQIYVTPVFGTFVRANDVKDLREEFDEQRIARAGTLALGLNVDAGWLRGSLAYGSGATLNERGIQNRDNIGDGSVLAVAADVIVRPLPRVLVQPYLIGGLGLKRQDYSYDRDGTGGMLSRERRDLALHAGIGADLMLGGFGIMAEISDYITRLDDGGFGQHDAFAFAGLRVRVGGGR
ncbi:hypothetical protein BH23GEM9_BH23GEM9_21780 [soil metagenome]